MTFNISPYVAAGPLKFGMKRTEVQALLGHENAPFTPGGKEVCDYYHSLGIFVAYDDDLTCSYITLAKPTSAIYKGKDLLCMNSKQLSKLLQDDGNLEIASDMLSSRLHGIGAVFEYKTKPVANIVLFKKGYYDKSDEWKQKLDTMNLADMSVDELLALLDNV